VLKSEELYNKAKIFIHFDVDTGLTNSELLTTPGMAADLLPITVHLSTKTNGSKPGLSTEKNIYQGRMLNLVSHHRFTMQPYKHNQSAAACKFLLVKIAKPAIERDFRMFSPVC
jgi:hypothetical protein